MAAITKSYGMLVDSQFQWLIRRGDLIISGEKTPIPWTRHFFYPAEGLVRGKCEIPVYYYRAREKNDDDVPTHWQDGQYGKNLLMRFKYNDSFENLDVEKAGVIKCDFSSYLDRELRPQPNPLPPGNQVVVSSRTRIGPLIWRLYVTNTSIEAELLLNHKQIARGEIKIETDRPQDRVYSTWPGPDLDD